VIADARPILSIRDAHALEELTADYQEVFKQRAVKMGVKRKCTTGSKLETPEPFASLLAKSL
jgi:hypothetical protein